MADQKTAIDQKLTGQPVVIKKYANRRLYDTSTSAYVTLDHLSALVKDGVDFIVQDAKSGEDITRSVLTQIIVEYESRGENLLPINFLRQMIRFYGDSIQALVPGYLDMSMEAFAKQQEQLREQLQKTFMPAMPGFPMAAGAMFPTNLEDTVRSNMAFYEQSMKLFGPMMQNYAQAYKTMADPKTASKPGDFDMMSQMRAQMDLMQRQLDMMMGRKSS